MATSLSPNYVESLRPRVRHRLVGQICCVCWATANRMTSGKTLRAAWPGVVGGRRQGNSGQRSRLRTSGCFV